MDGRVSGSPRFHELHRCLCVGPVAREAGPALHRDPEKALGGRRVTLKREGVPAGVLSGWGVGVTQGQESSECPDTPSSRLRCPGRPASLPGWRQSATQTGWEDLAAGWWPGALPPAPAVTETSAPAQRSHPWHDRT